MASTRPRQLKRENSRIFNVLTMWDEVIHWKSLNALGQVQGFEMHNTIGIQMSWCL